MTQNNRSLSLQDLGAFLLWITVAVVALSIGKSSGSVDVNEAQVGSPPEAKRAKKKHNLPPGAISSREIATVMVGNGVNLERPGPDVRFTVGYGVSIVIPEDVRLECRMIGIARTDFYVKAVKGSPYILLPFVGKLWPIGIIGAKLEGDMLTVELDGWTDYQVKIQ